MKKILAAGLLLVSAWGVMAQETTPEATEGTKALVGAIAFTLPSGWFDFPGNGGTVLVSNMDLMSVTDNNYPDGTIVLQINTGDIASLGDLLLTGAPTADDILKALAAAQGAELETQALTVNDVELAKADFSTENYKQDIYSLLISDQSFALVAAVGFGEDTLTIENDQILGVITSLELDLSAPFPSTTSEAYKDLPQSLSAEGFPQIGNPEAKVVIYEIASFDCPHCQEFHELGLPTIVERVKAGDVLFVYVPIFGTGGIPSGDMAALGAVCAGEQGAFWEYHDGAYNWQNFGSAAFLPERLLNGAIALELDIEAFTTCMEAQETKDLLQGAYNFATTTPGFQGTPTLIVNGTIVNWYPPEALNQVIDDALVAPEATAEATPAN